MYKAPRGTFDILPEEQPYWQYVGQKAVETCLLFGYERIETPVFEDADLFIRSTGSTTDIVEKEMYLFKDRGDNLLALRPEGTAPVCRAYVEHGMYTKPQPVKLYYLIEAFRYERPQARRYREHHQFGFEAIGSDDPALDAEVINMAWQFYTSLGLSDLFLVMNSIGCKQCRPDYIQALKGYYSAQPASQLCPDCMARMQRNPLRLLDCKNPSCQALADAAPRSVDYLCPECRKHYDAVKGFLNLMGFPFQENHRLVRGLDYYTRTVFEIQPRVEGAQSTVGGGGRYDGLIEQIGGRPTPAVGFATGIERTITYLKQANMPVPPIPRPVALVAHLGLEAKAQAVKLAADLRKTGISTLVSYGDRSLKSQLKQADSLGLRCAVILGEEEIKAKTALVRDMKAGDQKSIQLAELPAYLNSL